MKESQYAGLRASVARIRALADQLEEAIEELSQHEDRIVERIAAMQARLDRMMVEADQR